jgi:hypothetical protein
MNQGQEQDVLGGTTDPDEIYQLLQNNTQGWYYSASNAPPPNGTNPLEPIRPPSDPGRRYDDLGSLDLRGDTPNPNDDTIDPFVTAQMGEPDFVTNRDRNVAFYAKLNRQSGRHPTKGYSLIPTHVSPMEDHLWLRHHDAQIFDDPHHSETTGSTQKWTTRARFIHDDGRGVHYLVDYTRIDQAMFTHTDPLHPDRTLAESTRFVNESFRTVNSDLDMARSSSRGWPPGLPIPLDFHRSYSVREEPSDGRRSYQRPPGWRESEHRQRRSRPASPTQTRRMSITSQSQHSASSAGSSSHANRPGRWGKREQYIKQSYSVDEEGVPRDGWERRDRGTACGFPGGPFRWNSDLKGSSKNRDLTTNPVS